MKITVLGTGMVGQCIAAKMVELGHQVTMGTRDVNKTKQNSTPNQMTGVSFTDWYADNASIQLSNFQAAAGDADLVINATMGVMALEVLKAVGEAGLNGKILLDVSNPLDFSNGMPPTLTVCNTDSLGEQIQTAFPNTKVVKSLNTMSTYIMMNPAAIPGDHNVMMSGNDDKAKGTVKELLVSIGWKAGNVIDLGDISTARGTEMMLPVWLRLWNALGTADFNFHITQK